MTRYWIEQSGTDQCPDRYPDIIGNVIINDVDNSEDNLALRGVNVTRNLVETILPLTDILLLRNIRQKIILKRIIYICLFYVYFYFVSLNYGISYKTKIMHKIYKKQLYSHIATLFNFCVKNLHYENIYCIFLLYFHFFLFMLIIFNYI